jgi:hypothetical protein
VAVGGEHFGQGCDLQRCRTVIVVGPVGSSLAPASFLYMSIIRFAQFVMLRLPADIDKDMEILYQANCFSESCLGTRRPNIGASSLSRDQGPGPKTASTRKAQQNMAANSPRF